MQRAGLATGRENPRCRVGSVSEKLIATIHDCIVPHRPPASNIITATLCALPSAAAATAATAATAAASAAVTVATTASLLAAARRREHDDVLLVERPVPPTASARQRVRVSDLAEGKGEVGVRNLPLRLG
mmetsp:Transcript_8056/g.25599  ORF Transcript_8056/g.25599 Transcript_8056/m.25599 type:complete len:130 (-) Transcript_8056:1032-1421(-)